MKFVFFFKFSFTLLSFQVLVAVLPQTKMQFFDVEAKTWSLWQQSKELIVIVRRLLVMACMLLDLVGMVIAFIVMIKKVMFGRSSYIHVVKSTIDVL